MCDFQWDGRLARKSDTRWGAGTARGLNRDQIVKIARLTGCKNFVGKRKKIIFKRSSFIVVLHAETVQPSASSSQRSIISFACFRRMLAAYSAQKVHVSLCRIKSTSQSFVFSVKRSSYFSLWQKLCNLTENQWFWSSLGAELPLSDSWDSFLVSRR